LLHHKKTKLSPFLFAIFCSLLAHSPLLLLYWAPRAKTIKQPEESLVLVEYPVHQQIVSQEAFNNTVPKKQTHYLSQANKAVEKETQAMLKGLFYQAKTQNAQTSVRKALNKNQKPKNNTLPIQRQLSSLSPSVLDVIEEPIKINITELKHMDFSQQPKSQDLSRTMDFLPGVETGSHTLLNTREFIYYSYFSRMKEQIHWRWSQYLQTELPLTAFTLNHGNRQKIFSTSLYVYLSIDGEIQDMRVVKSSGEDNIDSAALHAFLSAAPFPNPPTGLVEEDGYIHIKQSFHLYINSFTSADLFSRQN
jgi:protein TonB